jgi:hypothetical protein
MTKIITHELLRSWEPREGDYKRFCQLFPEGADLETAIDGLVKDDRDDWAYWLFQRCKERGLYKDIITKGYRNSGDYNSGNYNSGNRNSGDYNSGYCNSGNYNSGNRNIGNHNSGYYNSGYRNSGDYNSGDYNSGHCNSGDYNSGNHNSGYRNSGDYNSGDYNIGYFCSTKPETVRVFNVDTPREVWEATKKPSFLYDVDLTYWVHEAEMTKAEKAKDPMFYVRGGQLRTRKYKEAWKKAWDDAPADDRALLLKLPNFDAGIFKDITGIDVNV